MLTEVVKGKLEFINPTDRSNLKKQALDLLMQLPFHEREEILRDYRVRPAV